MHYVELPNSENSEYWDIIKVYNEYRDWLETYAGKEGKSWKWHRGDRCARGVYIAEPEVTSIFKLKYGQ